MGDLLTQALVVLNVLSVVGGLVYFVSRMGSKRDSLTDAVILRAHTTITRRA